MIVPDLIMITFDDEGIIYPKKEKPPPEPEAASRNKLFSIGHSDLNTDRLQKP